MSKLSASAKEFTPSKGGGGGGDKPPSQPQPPVVFQPIDVPTGRYHYQREFTTALQQQTGRGRSFSFGVYDPSTDTRTQRVHVHHDDFGANSGVPAAKPDAPHRTELVNRATSPVTYQQELARAYIPVVMTPPKHE